MPPSASEPFLGPCSAADPDLDLDQRLRRVEDAERRARLGGFRPDPLANALSSFDTAAPGEPSEEAVHLAAFRSAVLRSRVWRLAQFARGLIGRRW